MRMLYAEKEKKGKRNLGAKKEKKKRTERSKKLGDNHIPIYIPIPVSS